MIKVRPKLLLIHDLSHSVLKILDLVLGLNFDVKRQAEAARLLHTPRIADAYNGPCQLRSDMRSSVFVLAALLLLNVPCGVIIWSGFV